MMKRYAAAQARYDAMTPPEANDHAPPLTVTVTRYTEGYEVTIGTETTDVDYTGPAPDTREEWEAELAPVAELVAYGLPPFREATYTATADGCVWTWDEVAPMEDDFDAPTGDDEAGVDCEGGVL